MLRSLRGHKSKTISHVPCIDFPFRVCLSVVMVFDREKTLLHGDETNGSKESTPETLSDDKMIDK